MLRVIFALLFAPFRLLFNLLTKPSRPIAEFEFTFGSGLCHIKLTLPKNENDDALIAGYIMYLARYFYICDERQIKLMQNLLTKEAEAKKKGDINFTEKIYQNILQTLNEQERYAVNKLFAFPKLPPLLYAEDKVPSYPIATYKLFVTEQNKSWGHIFHLSAGADILLLPLLVGIFYEYVKDKTKSGDVLDETIVRLISSYNDIDCRSSEALNKLPDKILREKYFSHLGGDIG